MPFETFFQVGSRSRSQGSKVKMVIFFVWAITCTFMHGFQNNFAVVALEETCHLKHFFREVEGQDHRGQRSKWSYIELVRAITCTFMHGFQNNFAQLLPSRRCAI